VFVEWSGRKRDTVKAVKEEGMRGYSLNDVKEEWRE
jgi:hypothetical protein